MAKKKAEQHVYLETAKESGVFRYRGKAGKHDDPESFERMMLKSGLRVQVLDAFGGLQINAKGKGVA